MATTKHWVKTPRYTKQSLGDTRYPSPYRMVWSGIFRCLLNVPQHNCRYHTKYLVHQWWWQKVINRSFNHMAPEVRACEWLSDVPRSLQVGRQFQAFEHRLCADLLSWGIWDQRRGIPVCNLDERDGRPSSVPLPSLGRYMLFSTTNSVLSPSETRSHILFYRSRSS